MKHLCSFGSEGLEFSFASHLKEGSPWSHHFSHCLLREESFHSGSLGQKIRKPQGTLMCLWATTTHLIMGIPQEMKHLVLISCVFTSEGGLRPRRMTQGSKKYMAAQRRKNSDLSNINAAIAACIKNAEKNQSICQIWIPVNPFIYPCAWKLAGIIRPGR